MHIISNRHVLKYIQILIFDRERGFNDNQHFFCAIASVHNLRIF